MKLGTVTFEGGSVLELHRRLADNPKARVAMLERSAVLLRRLTGYPIDKARSIMGLQSIAVKWDEEKHPRAPAGSAEGGQFSYHGGPSSILNAVLKKGLHPGGKWFDRAPAVYMAKNEKTAIKYALVGASRELNEEGETGVVFKVRKPVDAKPDEHMMEESYLVHHVIPPSEILAYRTFHLSKEEALHGHKGIKFHASRWHDVSHKTEDVVFVAVLTTQHRDITKWDEEQHPRAPAGSSEGGEFTYHGGPSAILAKVLKDGLKPGRHDFFGRKPAVYLAKEEELAANYAMRGAVLDQKSGEVSGVVFQVRKPADAQRDTMQEGVAYYVPHGIPPQGIVAYRVFHLPGKEVLKLKPKDLVEAWRKSGSPWHQVHKDDDLYYVVVLADSVQKWDESQHPRAPAGSPDGGEFTVGALTPGDYVGGIGKPLGFGKTRYPHPSLAATIKQWYEGGGHWQPIQQGARNLIMGPHGETSNDIDQARAKLLLETINKSPTLTFPLFRGLSNVGEFKNPKIGDTFSESLTSWTGKAGLAAEFAANSYGSNDSGGGGHMDDSGKYIPDDGAVILMLRANNTKGIHVSDYASKNSIVGKADEWITSGEYVTGFTDEKVLVVERIGPARGFNIRKWDEAQHPRAPAGSADGGQFTDGGDDSLSFNNKIDKMYKQQKVKDWEKDYVSGLPLRAYFGNSNAFYLNDLLRKDADLKSYFNLWHLNENLQDAFNKNALTVPADTHVYRIIGGPAVDKFAELKKGDTFTDNGYTSTGVTNPLNYGSRVYPDVGKDKAILHITTKEPMKALIYRDENELLFNKGRTFRVLSTQKHDSDTIVNVVMS